MVFLSQLLNKSIYYNNNTYAKVVDFGVSNLKSPFLSTVLLKREGKKYVVAIEAIVYENNTLTLIKEDLMPASYHEKDFYLAEDLLDKQVIDVTGKRLVRVNDVLLKEEGALAISAIDISLSGILRRLGLGSGPLKIISIPWSAIEAFDYQTGDIHLKLGKNTLNTLHPADLADILEEAGTKERLGLLESLDTEKAADTLEEANADTQKSVLEELPKSQLKELVEHMSLSELADILPEVNTKTIKEIYAHLGTDRSDKVKHLTLFAEDTAGGLMDLHYWSILDEKTIADLLQMLQKKENNPDAILVVNERDILVGMIEIKDIVNMDARALIKTVMKEAHSVLADTEFFDTLEVFAEYNIRVVPVVDKKKQIQGIISIDALISHLYAKEEENE